MPTPMLPALYTVSIRFDPSSKTFEFGGDVEQGADGASVPVATPLALIVLRLVPVRGQELSFAETPFLWVDQSGVAMDAPQCFETRLDTPQQITILDSNTLPGDRRYGFRVRVVADGEIHSSNDPTIVNRDTGGGAWLDFSELERWLGRG